MAFGGWTAEALEFFEGLEAENTKAYWTAHRDSYDQLVLAPMLALLEELRDEFGTGKVFRPYRDVRFSKDKSPYKTNIGATLDAGYVGLSVDGLVCGAGYYQLAPDQLRRYRAAVADQTGEELERIVASTAKKKVQVVGHDKLASAPRGYPKDHPRIDLLRNKGVTTWASWAPGPWLGTKAAKTRVVDALRASRPLLKWLDDNVGQAHG
jgi:uncharacterized protein (TIGR02453 family)